MEKSSVEYTEETGVESFQMKGKKSFPNENISQRSDAHDGDNCRRKSNWRSREAR